MYSTCEKSTQNQLACHGSKQYVIFERNLTSSGKVSIWSHIRITKLANPTYLRNDLGIGLEKHIYRDFPHICSYAVENRS